jgi:membrane associated rhomboid family serine protease
MFAAVPHDVWAVLRGGGLFPVATLVTSAFLHGGLTHLGFNMLFLWVFGPNAEDRLGHVRFLTFYLAGAVVAGLSQAVAAPSSTTPLVGASGAISAVLGAYLIFFPRAQVKTLFIIVIIVQTIVLPAWFFLGFWFVTQVLSSLYADAGQPGVAWYAHIGGFVFGVYVALKERAGERKRQRLSAKLGW